MSNNSESTSNKTEAPRKSKEDFEFLKEIGDGSFSTVYLAKEKKTGQIIAIKECEKFKIIKENKVKYVHLEKKILIEHLNNHPFFVKLCCTFQDDACLYFGLTYCPNGDLLTYLNKVKQFPVHVSQFYAAEIVDALAYMHGKKIVHRDLKPENILLDDKFHIKLTDFGSARILDAGSVTNAQASATSKDTNNSTNPTDPETGKPVRRRNSFVGTAQYVAPEVLNGKDPHIGCDLWALGCIVYQMHTGKHLFFGNHEYDIFQKIVRLNYSFPEYFNDQAKDLIQKLVVTEPSQRLGANEESQNGYAQLKQHLYFSQIDWTNLSEQTPPSLS